jgi:hypothetical protein
MFDLIRARRAIPKESNLAQTVKRVVVILTASRSGSSLLKQVLIRHPDIAALSGEMEPFLVLSNNIFPYAGQSDALDRIAGRDRLLDDIFNDLTIADPNRCHPTEIIERWRKRLLLQFPDLFARSSDYQVLLDSLEAIHKALERSDEQNEAVIHRLILKEIFHDEPWRINFYDGFVGHGSTQPFNEKIKIEEPPFVTPPLYRRAWQAEDAQDKVLLFKTPQDCYRIGIYEQLFPNARITYLHLSRGFAQTVNGLIDGWCLPTGFFAHDLRKVGIQLAIPQYSDTYSFGRDWWKFDLPPNWRRFTSAPLPEICLNQWLSAHQTILLAGVSSYQLRFEDFLADPNQVAANIFRFLGLPSCEISGNLPLVMTTVAPHPYRWRARANDILPFAEQHDVREVMKALGYSMDQKTWR